MKKKILVLLLVMLTMFTVTVNAKTDNGFYASDKVSVQEELNTSSFVAGKNVKVSSIVDGINLIAGNNVTVSSKQDYVFIAGNVIKLNEVTTKDAFIAGSLISINSSTIRDLYVAGDTIDINSNIDRNIYAGGNIITINSTINGDVNLSASNITIGDNAIINGQLKYNEDAEISISETSTIASTKVYETSVDTEYVNETGSKEITIARVSSKLMSYIMMLVISLLLIALNKKVFKKIASLKKDFPTVLTSTIIGFAILCCLPIASIILLVTVIGIPISIISLLIYAILIYLSVLPTAYYFSEWLLKDKIDNYYLRYTITLLVIYFLQLMPYIGGFVSLISLCMGLGLYTTLFMYYIKSNK